LRHDADYHKRPQVQHYIFSNDFPVAPETVPPKGVTHHDNKRGFGPFFFLREIPAEHRPCAHHLKERW